MISYNKKAAKILRGRIQRLGTPPHIVEAMTLEMLVNLYKMSKRLSASGMLARHRERDTALLVERARGRVLDVGCGIGRIAFSLALANPDLAVTGIDIDAEKIEIAAEIAESSGVRNLAFAVDNMFDLRIAGPFDTVVAKQVLADTLEHSGEAAVDALLSPLLARLAPGGRLFVVDVTPVRDLLDRAGRVAGEPVEVRPVVSVRGERTDTLYLFELKR